MNFIRRLLLFILNELGPEVYPPKPEEIKEEVEWGFRTKNNENKKNIRHVR